MQLVPHLTSAIQDAIVRAGEGSDVHIVEIGGTVGDYEALSFVEAIREFSGKTGRDNCLFVHVVYVPFISTSKEFKTKPAQNALSDLRGFGIVPDIVIVRSDDPAPRIVANKIALFGGVPEDAVLLMPNVDSVFKIPAKIAQSPINNMLDKFTGVTTAPDMSKWQDLVARQQSPKNQTVKVGLVAKYLDNEDTYISVIEALKAAAWQEEVELETVWIDAEKATAHDFAAVDALLVPGGFGARGVDGKIAAVEFALDNKKPYLGICLGMQTAVLAAARRGGVPDADSTEMNATTKHDVIYIMAGQAGKESTGGTLRLGDYPARLADNSLAQNLYGQADIIERHRHRYEVNLAYRDAILRGGLNISGTSPDGSLVEFVEAVEHPYFIATQAHPEFKSRPHRPHPLFVGLIQSAKFD